MNGARAVDAAPAMLTNGTLARTVGLKPLQAAFRSADSRSMECSPLGSCATIARTRSGSTAAIACASSIRDRGAVVLVARQRILRPQLVVQHQHTGRQTGQQTLQEIVVGSELVLVGLQAALRF